ncbi:MAG: class II aldolase/adducin family protein [Nitrososphaerota archaeon]
MSEQELKRKIVAVGKKAFEYRLLSGTWGNISARLGKDRMLITPSGFEKTALRPSDMLLMDLQGNILRGKWRPSSEVPMHSLIYKTREDVSAVIHTHSYYATALAVAGQEIPVLTSEFASAVGHKVPVTRYITSGTWEFAEEVIRTLGDGKAVLVRNHGVVVVGDSLEDAFQTALLVEDEARTFVLASSLGYAMPLDVNEVKRLREAYIRGYGQEKRRLTLKL